MKTVIQIILAIAIVVLGYLLYESVMTPIRFNKEKDLRYERTINRLRNIRTAQVAYKSQYDKYTGSFDTLISFVKTDSFNVVKAEGVVPDGYTEAQALEEGIISRDTVKVGVADSLFKPNFNVEKLRYVPFTDGKEFEMAAGEIETGSKVTVQVFEAKVPNNVLLHDLDRQLVINFNDEREKITGYPGLKVGSLTEATNNAGNWE
ncbi:MAG: hypothetical protein ACOC0C_00750 [Bacteroidota bacterium]